MTDEGLSTLVENLTIFKMTVIFVFLFFLPFFFLILVIFRGICYLRKMKNCKEI